MRKNYDAWRAEQGVAESFVIGGQEFTPRNKLPWEKFGKLLMSMDEDDAEDIFAKTREFYSLVLKRADRQRFLDLLSSDGDEDDEAVVDSMQVNELTKDLMEFYTGKALEAATPSDVVHSELPSNVVSLTPHKLTG